MRPKEHFSVIMPNSPLKFIIYLIKMAGLIYNFYYI